VVGNPRSDFLDHELAVLTADYEATREDQRQAFVRDVAIVSIGVAVFAAFYYLSADKEVFLRSRPLLAAALPLAPAFVAVTWTYYAVETMVRGYYIRVVERAIQERVPIKSALGEDIQLPAFGHLSTAAYGARLGGWRVAFLNGFAWIAVLGLYGGSAVVALTLLPSVVDMVAAGAVYTVLAAVILEVLYTTVYRPRATFLEAVTRYRQLRREPLDRLIRRESGGWSQSRAGLRYLALPHLADVVKWVIFLLTWLGALTTFAILNHFTGREIKRSLYLAVLFLVTFEYLVYQARYQWNDLRGASEDRIHVAAADRGRLPEGWERRSLAALVVRLLLAGYLVHLALRGDPLLWPALAILALPLLIAIPYEELRRVSATRQSDTSRGPRRIHVAIYMISGLGYATRAAVGVLIGSLFGVDWLTLTVAFLAVAFAASSDVVMYWAMESIAEQEPHLRPHVAALRPYATIRYSSLPSNDSPRTARLFVDRDLLTAPWSLLHLAGVALGALGGLALAGWIPPQQPSQLWFGPVFIVGWVAFATWLKSRHVRTAAAILVMVLIAAIAALTLVFSIGPGLSVLLPGGIITLNLYQRRNNFDDCVKGPQRFARSAVRSAVRATRALARWAFGDEMARTLFGGLMGDSDRSALATSDHMEQARQGSGMS